MGKYCAVHHPSSSCFVLRTGSLEVDDRGTWLAWPVMEGTPKIRPIHTNLNRPHPRALSEWAASKGVESCLVAILAALLHSTDLS